MTPLELTLLAAAVGVGAASQRLTGMGFALVAAPLLVLLLGPDAGVTLIQVLGVTVSGLLAVSVWRDIDWRTLPWLLVPALATIPAGVWIVRTLPASVLQIGIGALIVVSLGATVLSERARVFTGRPGAAAAGLLSGIMNTTAGVGGPALVLYRLSVDWSQAAFVATLQVYFVALSAPTVLARGVPALVPAQWVAAFAALLGGLALGGVLARRVPERAARRLTIGIALAGGVATMVKGILTL